LRGKNWPVTGSLGNLTGRFLAVVGKARVLRRMGGFLAPRSLGSSLPKNKDARIKSLSLGDSDPPRFFMDEREPKTLAHVFTTWALWMLKRLGALTTRLFLDIYTVLMVNCNLFLW